MSFDPHWYRYAWDAAVSDMPWAEATQTEVDLVMALTGLGPCNVLDVACGEGRHSIELAKRGHRVVGVDTSKTLLQLARAAAERDSVRNVRFEQSDIRALPFEGEFDLVLNLWEGAIGYLEDDVQNGLALGALARALVPGGHHIAGPLINADYLATHCPFQSWERNERVIQLSELDWDPETRRVIDRTSRLRRGPHGNWRFEANGGEVRYRAYAPDELAGMLSELGLETRCVYGSSHLKPHVGSDDMEYWIHSLKLPVTET